MYLCGPRKHNCQPLCGPEGRFYCSDSVCSLRPALFSYLCVRVRIWGCWKVVCCCRIKPDCCRTPAVVSIFTDSAACVLSFYHYTPLHITYAYIFSNFIITISSTNDPSFIPFGVGIYLFVFGINLFFFKSWKLCIYFLMWQNLLCWIQLTEKQLNQNGNDNDIFLRHMIKRFDFIC